MTWGGGERHQVSGAASLVPAVVLNLVLDLVLELVLDPGGAADPDLSVSPAHLEAAVPALLTDWKHLC